MQRDHVAKLELELLERAGHLDHVPLTPLGAHNLSRLTVELWAAVESRGVHACARGQSAQTRRGWRQR